MVRQPLPSSDAAAKTSTHRSGVQLHRPADAQLHKSDETLQVTIMPHVGNSLDPSYTEVEDFDTTITASLVKSDLHHGYKMVTTAKPSVVPISELMARKSKRITKSASLTLLQKQLGNAGNSQEQCVLSAVNKGHSLHEKRDEFEPRQRIIKASDPEHSITRSSFVVADAHTTVNNGYQQRPDFDNVEGTLYEADAVPDTKDDAPLFLMPDTACDTSSPISKTINPPTSTELPILEQLERPCVQAFSTISQMSLPSSMKNRTAIEISVSEEDANATSKYLEPAPRVSQKLIAPRDSDVYEKITAAVERQLSFAAKAQHIMPELVHPALDIVSEPTIGPFRTRSRVFDVVRAIEEKSARVDFVPIKSRRKKGQCDKVESLATGSCTNTNPSAEKRHDDNITTKFSKVKEGCLNRTSTVEDDSTNKWVERTTHTHDVLTVPYRRRSITVPTQPSNFAVAQTNEHDESMVYSASSAVISTPADQLNTGVFEKSSEAYQGRSTTAMPANPMRNLLDAYILPENIIQIVATPYIYRIGSGTAIINLPALDAARKALSFQDRRNSWPIVHKAQNMGSGDDFDPRHHLQGYVAPIIPSRSLNDSSVSSGASDRGKLRGVTARESRSKGERMKTSTTILDTGERNTRFSTSRCSAFNKDVHVGYTSYNPTSRHCKCTQSTIHNSNAHESTRCEKTHASDEAVKVEQAQERVRKATRSPKQSTRNSRAEEPADAKVSKLESTEERWTLHRPQSLIAVDGESRITGRCDSLEESDRRCRPELSEVHMHNNQVQVFLTSDADKSKSTNAKSPKIDPKGATAAVFAERRLERTEQQALSELDTQRSIPGMEYEKNKEDRIRTQISPHRRDWSQYPLCARTRSWSPTKQIRDVRDGALTREYRRAISPGEKSSEYGKSRPMRNRGRQSRRNEELEGEQNKQRLRGRSGLRGVFSYFIEVALGVDVNTE